MKIKFNQILCDEIEEKNIQNKIYSNRWLRTKFDIINK